MKAREILIYLATKFNYEGIVSFLKNKIPLPTEANDYVVEHAMTIVDQDYPDEFKILPNPPIVIWATDELDEKYSHDNKSRLSKEYFKKITGHDLHVNNR